MTPLILAIPSKGRLQDNALAFLARAGLKVGRPRGGREYRGTIAGLAGVEIAITKGVLPFIYGAVFKIGLAAAVLPMAWKLTGERDA